MSTVAEELRNARQARSLSVEQVAEITKMRADQVRALEEGDFQAFAAPVYLRGSVRTYSALLRLDVPSVMRLLDSELGQTGRTVESAPRPARPAGILDQMTLQLSRLDWRKALTGAVVAVFLVLLVIGYFAWRNAKTSDPLKNLGPGIYKPTNDSSQSLPLPSVSHRRP